MRRYWRDRNDCRCPCMEVWWGHRYFSCFLTPRHRPSNIRAVGRFLPRSWPLVARSPLGSISTYRRQNGAADGVGNMSTTEGRWSLGLFLPLNNRAQDKGSPQRAPHNGLEMLAPELMPGISLEPRSTSRLFPSGSRPGDFLGQADGPKNKTWDSPLVATS